MSLLDNPDPTPTPSPEPTPADPTPTPADPTPTPLSFAGFIDEKGTFKPDADWSGYVKELGLGDDFSTENFTKFKTLDDLAKGFANATKLAGGKKVGVEIPSGPDDPKLAEFRKALGVPDKPEGYGISKPDELPEGVEWNEEAIGKYLDVLHKHNATPALVKELLGLNTQLTGDSVAQAIRQKELSDEQTLKAEGDKLLDEHGSTVGQVKEKAIRAALAIGLDPQTNPLFNSAATVNAFAKMADMLGEDNLPVRTENVHKTRYDEAQRIMTDPTHPEYNAYYAGDDRVIAKVTKALAEYSK